MSREVERYRRIRAKAARDGDLARECDALMDLAEALHSSGHDDEAFAACKEACALQGYVFVST